MTDPPAPGDSPLQWTDDGLPRSARFGDIYYSAEDGLAETRAVFLDGCGLPDRWAGRRRFTVAELGFGVGLNVAALLDLWRRAGPGGAQLHIFSVEAFPVSAADARRALARWPELADAASALTAAWPGQARGIHRRELPDYRAILDVAVMDAGDALAGWRGAADAWFLDGFAPALNPRMWSDDLLQQVGARSAPGARAATYTVAGQVRRGLSAAGFAVEKRPGFGRKRERLEARRPGAAAEPRVPSVAVVGGGIAGAALARAFRTLGAEPRVLEAVQPGTGASGNPAALVTPRLDAGLGVPAALYAGAFARAVALYGAVPEAVLARGVLQLAQAERDLPRFRKIAGSDLFEPGALQVLDAAEASARLGEPAPAALEIRQALVVRPPAVLAAWMGEALTGRVAHLRPGGHGDWCLLDAEGAEIARADVVAVAAGAGSADLIAGLPLSPVRGQASWRDGLAPIVPAAWGGYAIPTGAGVLFGATHDRGDVGADLREADHRRNLETLARARPVLAARLAGEPLAGRAAVRAVTPDRLPIAGPAGPPGLFALTGLGSRGFAFAPWLAEHLAALAVGAPSPLPAPQAALLAWGRFAGA